MADRDRVVRELVERLLFAGVGAVSLSRERIEELADALAHRGDLTTTEARQTVEDVAARWRGDASRLGERAGASLTGVFRELGLVTRREHEELELRLAQLEHRLRLVEGAPGAGQPPS